MGKLNIGLIWVGGVGLPAIAMALAKVDSMVWSVLIGLGFICLATTVIIKNN